MSRIRLSVIFLALALIIGCGQGGQKDSVAEPLPPSASELAEPLPVLPPSVAGSFYPARSDTLRSEVGRYLGSANPPDIDGEIIAAIVPHAGYVYSAPVAAYVYKAIEKQEQKESSEGKKLDAVIVVAFDHRGRSPAVSVYYKGAMETPLGRKPVNEDVAREFMRTDPRLSFIQAVHAGEHSAEVQIPFLQTILPKTPIVPILFGWQNRQNIEEVSKGLEDIAKKYRLLVIGTTDLSHYNPYEQARAFDTQTVQMILGGKPTELARYVSEHPDRMCGSGPVLSVLSYAESRGAEPVLLKYANSGDTSGRKDAVVGYSAIVFVRKDTSKAQEVGAPTSTSAGESEPDYLSSEEKKTLLALARRSMESFVHNKKIIEVDPPASARLKENGAAFVTLKKNGQLRGCIGTMEPMMPLYQVIIRMAVAAASQDYRFPPVTPEELNQLHIEISVNTPLRLVTGPDEIMLGKDGVVVEKGGRRGVFLPQVATETGWTKEEFLENLCAGKAGLAPDAYKDGANLYVFNSIVFEEEEHL